MVKNRLPMQEMQEMQVQSLGWEDPLEEEMATHSSIPAWKIPQTEEPGGLVHGFSKELDTAECVPMHACTCTHTRTHTQHNLPGNGSSLVAQH